MVLVVNNISDFGKIILSVTVSQKNVRYIEINRLREDRWYIMSFTTDIYCVQISHCRISKLKINFKYKIIIRYYIGTECPPRNEVF